MTARTNIANADAEVPDTPADAVSPQEGGHYYDVDDDGRELMSCIGVLDDGRAVLGTGGTMRIVDATKLARVPSTAGEVLKVLGGLTALADAIDGGEKIDTAALRRYVTAVDVWVRGIPGIPDTEK